jgi:sRNA-binding regulator protein Hfq
MGYLRGLNDYLRESYSRDLFQENFLRRTPLAFHLSGHRKLTGRVKKNMKFDVDIYTEQNEIVRVPKLNIKFFYPLEWETQIAPLIESDEAVKQERLKPIKKPDQRRHVKNKTLYPLMVERTPVVLTSYEGDVIRGFVDDFTKYEIIIKLHGTLTVTVLRHAIHLFTTLDGRDLLKTFQEKAKDWQKSSVWVNNDEA